MSRRIPTLGALLVALAALAAAGCSRARGDYMPLAVGNRWDYRVLQPGRPVERWRLELTGRVGERTWAGADGDGVGVLWSKEDEMLSVQRRGQRIYLLWLPPAVGAGWWTTAPGSAKVWCKVVARPTVAVPAGTFRACVEVLMEPVGGRTEMRHWFAPGIGWVRYSYGPRGGRPWMVRELTGYQLRPAAKWGEALKKPRPPGERK